MLLQVGISPRLAWVEDLHITSRVSKVCSTWTPPRPVGRQAVQQVGGLVADGAQLPPSWYVSAQLVVDGGRGQAGDCHVHDVDTSRGC